MPAIFSLGLHSSFSSIDLFPYSREAQDEENLLVPPS